MSFKNDSVKNLPAMWETWVQSLGWEDLLEKGMATHSSILAQRIPPVTQTTKNLPAMQETQVQSLGGEDLLEKGMATHSCTPAWRIPWTEEPGRLHSMGLQRVGHN